MNGKRDVFLLLIRTKNEINKIMCYFQVLFVLYSISPHLGKGKECRENENSTNQEITWMSCSILIQQPM